MVSFKPGVTTDKLAPAGKVILAALEAESALCQTLPGAYDVLVTCTTGEHPPADPHSKGGAMDVSVFNMPPQAVWARKQRLQMRLGAEFTVLYESPVDPPEGSIWHGNAYVNRGATAVHLHIQLKLGLNVTTWNPGLQPTGLPAPPATPPAPIAAPGGSTPPNPPTPLSHLTTGTHTAT